MAVLAHVHVSSLPRYFKAILSFTFCICHCGDLGPLGTVRQAGQDCGRHQHEQSVYLISLTTTVCSGNWILCFHYVQNYNHQFIKIQWSQMSVSGRAECFTNARRNWTGSACPFISCCPVKGLGQGMHGPGGSSHPGGRQGVPLP